MRVRISIAERRRRNKVARQQKADRLLQQKLRTAQRCPKHHGGGVCNGELSTRTGNFGETVVVCIACERQKQGLCRYCPRPIAGGPRSLYCEVCRPIVHRQQMRDYAERNLEKIRIRALEHLHNLSPEDRDRGGYYSHVTDAILAVQKAEGKQLELADV